MKNNFKKFLAALTVFAMALALVAVPLATAKAAPNSGTYKTGQSWWGGGSYLVGYAAESGTIGDIEKAGQGGTVYWPEGGFAWWSAVTFDLQADGTWLVTDVIKPSAENNLENVPLKTGRLVVTFHEACLNEEGFRNAANTYTKSADSFEFFSSLKVGDKLSALGMWDNEITWEALAKNEDQATFTKISSASTDTTPSTPSTDTTPSTDKTPSTGTDTTPSTGSNNNVPATGDSMPVAVMASVLLAAVAMVAYGLKKRNA